jgi:hypothetical protein
MEFNSELKNLNEYFIAEISEKWDFGAKFSEVIKLEKFFIIFEKTSKKSSYR